MSSLLSSTLNTRTFDKYKSKDSKCLSDRLWRSDVPENIQENDIDKLLENGITTIIDMRTEREVQRRPNALANDKRFVYLHYPIEEGSEPPESLEAVPLSYMKIAGGKFAADIFKAIADAPDGVLFHCTAGKDRTGVISAVLLMLCGVDNETIIQDYVISRENNRERLEKFLNEHPEIDRNIVLANEKSMERFISLFNEKYGSAESYLFAVGITAEQPEKIKSKMI